MTVSIEPSHSTPAWPLHGHAVQFYDDDAVLHRSVADFIADGLVLFEPAVVIARPENRAGIVDALAAKGFDVDDLIRSEQLTLADAAGTLKMFMSNREPDARRFNEVIGGVLRRAAGAHRVRIRAYGEMVDLLWREGNGGAAIRLEALWNEIASEHSFALLCAYRLGNFYSAAHAASFDAICHEHTVVLPHDPDASDDREVLLRQIATLRQRAEALKTEVAHRQQLETALRDSLAEQWAAQENLRRSERELKDFFDNATIGLHWVGAGGTILWANDAELNLLGYTRDEYVGRHIADFHADSECIDDILATLQSGGELRERRARLRAKDGSIRHVAISSNALFEDGRFVHTRCFTRDITEQQRLEDERDFLLEATTVLNRSLDYASRLRDLARLVVPRLAGWCAIDIATADGAYDRVSAPDESANDVHREAVLTVLRSGQASIGEERLTVPMHLGQRVLGAITLAGRRFTEADLPLTIELARRAAIAIENSRLFRLAQEGNRTKDEFLATLSHELRTPLTAILGWARMLRMGPLDPAVTATALETIERSAQSQAALIDDILDLSKVVTGKMSLQLDLVDLVKTVEGAIETVRLAATAKRVTVAFTPPDAPAFVAGDPTRLQQITWNLLSNAIKFSNPDTVVSVAIEQTPSTVKLVVRDAGVGIRAQFLPHVFEAFRQAEASTTRTYSGLGLGLAIVKYFAELHGGSVHAESAGEGRGATFSVSLPLVVGHSAVPREVQAAVDLRGTSVLLVEDDADTRTMIATVLHARGADVRIASSVTQACTMLEGGAVDLILTDIAMPERDGFSLVEHLQRDGNGLSQIPVIALTALGRPEDEANILAAGFRAYARKPIEPQRLTELVAKMASGA